MRPVTRLEPAMPAHAYKTYAVTAPPATHWRPATCQEVDCQAYAHGWRTVLDTATEHGAKSANYIRLQSGRSFTISQAGSVVTFTFPAGQACFAQHRVPLERPALFLVGQGDHRLFHPRAAYRHRRPEDWVDDFGTHQDRLADRLNRG